MSAGTEKRVHVLRVMIVVTLVIETLQFFFGEATQAVVIYPTNLTVVNSVGGIISALSNAGGTILLWHATEGLILLLAAVGTTAISLRFSRRGLRVSSVLGLISAFVAVAGGYVWVSSGFNNPGGILLMVNGAVGMFAFYFIALYYTK